MPMPILASVCWEAGFVWLCGGWVCGIPRVVAWWCCGVLRVVACVPAWSRGCVPALLRGRARVLVWRACSRVVAGVGVWGGGVGGGAARVGARPPLGGVLWRFPTLPHPLGCSTIGAAGLSFQVRNVAGRFPGAVTTTRLCRPSPPLVGPPCGGLGGGWVGRGSYSGCGASPGLVRWARCGLVAGGCRGVVVPPVWWLGGVGVVSAH